MALSVEAPADNFDDLILLLLGHLIVTGKTQAPVENVCANVCSILVNVGVGPAKAVSFFCDEGVGTVDRLKMHRLPDGTPLRTEGYKRFQDFRRR